MHQSDQVIVLMDSSKVGKNVPIKYVIFQMWISLFPMENYQKIF